MNKKPRLVSLMEALLVTFLWSSSYVLVKLGLREMPPLVFVAIRYFLAFLVLLAAGVSRRRSEPQVTLGAQEWLRLIIMGVAGCTVAQASSVLGSTTYQRQR
ncbi:MAG: putative DMT superfamily transporter inner membrane protein [Candidatus Bathyarchaeota archaeon BA1]|nr:MAG: putative DMT superfamily transporter inner membrane protein [Candidatus Bathyarchaeota archaeon BA1]